MWDLIRRGKADDGSEEWVLREGRGNLSSEVKEKGHIYIRVFSDEIFLSLMPTFRHNRY